MHAGAHAAMIRALRASGVVVSVRPEDFLAMLKRVEDPLVVTAHAGLVSKKYHYLTSYKGLAFYAKSATPLMLPRHVETVLAEKIWIPGS